MSSIAEFLSVALLADMEVHTITPGPENMRPLRGREGLVVCPKRHVAMRCSVTKNCSGYECVVVRYVSHKSKFEDDESALSNNILTKWEA